jgi:hypothetical protein
VQTRASDYAQQTAQKYDDQVQRIQAAVDAGKKPPKTEGGTPAEDAPAEA